MKASSSTGAGGGPSAGSWVRRSMRAVGLARAAEALAVGTGCGLALWAICLLEGTAGGARLAGTLTGGTCAMAAWWLAHRPRAVELARSIDAAMGQGGQFVTAYQRENQGADDRAGSAGTGIAALLAQRARSGLRWREVRQAVLPASLACAAAPFAGAALLAAALQFQRDLAPDGIAAFDLDKDVLSELISARNAAISSGSLSDEATEGVESLMRQAGELLGEQAAGSPAASPAERSAGLAELRERLEEVALEAQADPEVDLHLERAAGGLDVLAQPSGGELAQVGAQSADDEAAGDPGAEAGSVAKAAPGDPASQPAQRGQGVGGGDPASRLASGGKPAEGSGSASADPRASSAGEASGPDGTPGALAPDFDKTPAGLDWLDTLPSERRDLALRWLERRSGTQ